MKRIVIGSILLALMFSVAGVGGTSHALDAGNFCSTGFQTQTFSNNNGYLSEEMTRTCTLRWAGPNLSVFGGAYSFTYRCATIDSQVCTIPLPTERRIRVSIYYKTVRLAYCDMWGGPNTATFCQKSKSHPQNLRPGLYLKCVVYGQAQIAYQMSTAGTCSSRK
jgi:hypothetical protein